MLYSLPVPYDSSTHQPKEAGSSVPFCDKTRTERIGSLDVATSCERKIDCVIYVTLLNKFLQRFPSWKYIKYNAACTCISSGKYNFNAGLLQIK